jgi:hypothetical protein
LLGSRGVARRLLVKHENEFRREHRKSAKPLCHERDVRPKMTFE